MFKIVTQLKAANQTYENRICEQQSTISEDCTTSPLNLLLLRLIYSQQEFLLQSPPFAELFWPPFGENGFEALIPSLEFLNTATSPISPQSPEATLSWRGNLRKQLFQRRDWKETKRRIERSNLGENSDRAPKILRITVVLRGNRSFLRCDSNARFLRTQSNKSPWLSWYRRRKKLRPSWDW